MRVFGVVGLARVVVGVGLSVLSMDACGPESSSFLTVWETTPDATVTIPTGSDYSYLFDVDCENDGVWDFEAQSGPVTCSYDAKGEYTVAVRGEYPYFRGNRMLRDVRQWGDIKWQSMRGSFTNLDNAQVTATDVPDLRSVTDMRAMFFGAGAADPDVSGWDVSNVTAMSAMFTEALVADPDVSGWDVSNVTDTERMFFLAGAADPDVSGWDVSSVTDMSFMFSFAGTADPDVSGWDVSNVTDMTDMFSFAGTANPDVSSWDVSSVTEMGGMFWNAVSANPDVSSWDVSNVTNMSVMFSNSGLSPSGYDALLNSWSGQAVRSTVRFGAEGRTYCNGGPSRQRLIDDYGWSISDGGLDQTCN